MTSSHKGIVWLSDEGGQVFQGQLLDFDSSEWIFIVQSSRDFPTPSDVVVILKNGELFPSGKPEWCGRALLLEKKVHTVRDRGQILCRLQAARA